MLLRDWQCSLQHRHHHRHISNALHYDVTVATSLGDKFFSSVIISWDHGRTCGLSLTKMSLCGARLYCKLCAIPTHLISAVCRAWALSTVEHIS